MARLREVVRDPRAGEIRLVWWREALTGARRDEAQGNPGRLRRCSTRWQKFRPPPHLIENAIAARQFDLYDDPFPATVDLEAYLGETRSGLIQIAALALGEGRDLGSAEASGLAGVALGLVELLRGLCDPRPLSFAPRRSPGAPWSERARFSRASRDPVGHGGAARNPGAGAPAARRGRARRGPELPGALAPAYAGLAAAPLWLDAIARNLPRAFEQPPNVAAWRRQLALWLWTRRA